MSHTYMPLPLFHLPAGTSYSHPMQAMPGDITMESPANRVMTDLHKVTAVTVEPNVSINWALQHMKESGVRMLLVINPSGDVIGLITTTDIQGEKPMLLMNEIGGRYEELRVRDIMTPGESLDVMRMEDVLKACVGDVVVSMQRIGRRHALVADGMRETMTRDGIRPKIRGIFSLTQISRQLGEPIDCVEVATSFAEVGVALSV